MLTLLTEAILTELVQDFLYRILTDLIIFYIIGAKDWHHVDMCIERNIFFQLV